MMPSPGRLLFAVMVLLGTLPVSRASAKPAEKPAEKSDKPALVYKVTFTREGDAKVHCACVTTRGGCDVKLKLPLAEDGVHQWWQTVQADAGKPVDISAACWRKRDVPGHGDALCCSPDLNPDGLPVPAHLKSLYAATATREPAE